MQGRKAIYIVVPAGIKKLKNQRMHNLFEIFCKIIFKPFP